MGSPVPLRIYEDSKITPGMNIDAIQFPSPVLSGPVLRDSAGYLLLTGAQANQ
ncbi:MAG: hypothetical protein KTR25_19070 [Myxococcales bacterium]|nr:hypothetical protein [Myxococcales bacterium]